ncbi:MAG: NAD-dependent epimerase/dehydratase family protein [Bacteroidetes bacterium]|nr:NAD-dependent epimerase/dehydratase family protein [Bacteroidota bacterium]
MQKALITGADGFIGSHLTELLLEKGYRVRALAQYNSFNYWGWLEDIPRHQNLEIVSGDIRDPHFCREITKGQDIIFHLAALIAIPYSYVAPDSYVDTNVKGTLNICQAAKEHGNIRVIHTSTSEVYGTANYVPIDEKHPKQAQSPYSASKISADAMALSFFHSFELPVTVARPFNTYGPRQSARAFIPTVITQMLSGDDTIKTGDLSPTRDLNYVKDTCLGFLALANCDESIGKEVNIASNYEISMANVLEKIREILKVDVSFVTDEQRIRPKDSEVFRLWGDNSLIRELTGFKPACTLEEGLELTCSWFSAEGNMSKYKTDIYNL